MEGRKVILYIHGMGGGADSRIPSILNGCMPAGFEVVVRTYDFDPETAAGQISSWIEELHPAVIAGESLGANHALEMRARYGLPTVLVSPALNAPAVLRTIAPLTLIPGVGALLGLVYKPRSANGVLPSPGPLRPRSSPFSGPATITAGAASCPCGAGGGASARGRMPFTKVPISWRNHTSGPFWQSA